MDDVYCGNFSARMPMLLDAPRRAHWADRSTAMSEAGARCRAMGTGRLMQLLPLVVLFVETLRILIMFALRLQEVLER